MTDLDRWLKLGRDLSSRTDVTRWQLGDWFLTGEEMFSESVYQHVVPLLEGWVDSENEVFYQPTLTETTLRQYAWMAQSYAEADRHEGQSYTSHRLVAKLSDRSQWLSRSAKEGWTAKQLKDALLEAGLITPSTRVKKYSVEELEGLLLEYAGEPKAVDFMTAEGFVEWLGEQA